MNRTETEAAISGHLPRRARRHLPAIMAAVDAHATAEREDLDRVAAEGARRQKLVADEFQAVKAERDELATELRNLNSTEGSARAEAAELGKQVRVLVEERAAALAEANKFRQQFETARDQRNEVIAERDRLTGALREAQAQWQMARNEADAANAAANDLAAERDRLREQLADAPKLTIRDLSGCSCQYTVMPDGSFSRTLPRAECRADHSDGGMPAGASVIANDGEPAPAPDGAQ